MDATRPLDALNMSRGKRVVCELKNGRIFTGTLRAFDIHINTVLEEASEMEGGEVKRKLGLLFIRGDAITLITPQGGDE